MSCIRKYAVLVLLNVSYLVYVGFKGCFEVFVGDIVMILGFLRIRIFVKYFNGYFYLFFFLGFFF